CAPRNFPPPHSRPRINPRAIPTKSAQADLHTGNTHFIVASAASCPVRTKVLPQYVKAAKGGSARRVSMH
ncbi:MAG: hypothetical protein Q8O48_10610, partial [Anaerolineales bacterium]|nr:hypothetical protein [Anaerolineales bacterium]